MASVIAALSLALFTWNFFRQEFPDVSVLKTRYPQLIASGDKTKPQVKIHQHRYPGWSDINDISKEAIGAVVVSEDWAFYNHRGYDPTQIREAIREHIQEGRFVRGASTITQQVIKNVFLERDRTLWRKLKELYLAVRLEEKVSKRRILEIYLNIAEWGDGIFGIRSAAERLSLIHI